jgi:uncharacterized MAPEG superfamily protein
MHATPYVSLFAAFLLIYAPRLVVAREQARQPEGYDNAHPRAQQAKLTGLGLRAQGAHMNGFEVFAPFAAGVLACGLRQIDPARVDALCIAFLVARLVYVGLYLGNLATLRSTVWTLGFLAVCGLLGSAAWGG